MSGANEDGAEIFQYAVTSQAAPRRPWPRSDRSGGSRPMRCLCRLLVVRRFCPKVILARQGLAGVEVEAVAARENVHAHIEHGQGAF